MTRVAADGCLVVVGVSHHTTSVELREKLALCPAQWHAGMQGQGAGSVLLATCNRVEAYGWGSGRGARLAASLRRALARAAGVSLGEVGPHLFVKTGRDALLHLVRVVSGLDSLVQGEDQIRGQVREAHRLAQESGNLPAPLDGVFGRALEAGRLVRGGTALGRQPSVASAAVEVARRMPHLDPAGLDGKHAVVIGAGVMARSAGRALLAAGARVTITNRTAEHAHRLAVELGHADLVATAPLDALPHLLVGADVVVGVTAARRPVVGRRMVEAAVAGRPGRPLVLLDVAMPRNVDPAVRTAEGAILVDLDDLEKLCPIDARTRLSEVARAEALAVEHADAIARWLRVRAVAPTIVELRERAEGLRAAELRRAAARLHGLTPEQQAAVDQLTVSLVNKLLHGPTVAVREAAARAPAATLGRRRGLGVLELLRLDEGRTGARTTRAD